MCVLAKRTILWLFFFYYFPHNIFIKYVLFSSAFIFSVFICIHIYRINTFKKNKKKVYKKFFACFFYCSTHKKTLEILHRRLACSKNKIQMHTVLFCFRMEWMKFPVIKNVEWKKSNKKIIKNSLTREKNHIFSHLNRSIIGESQ